MNTHAQKQRYSTAMVFGVFDGLHEGHTYFLSEAMKRCDQLTVVVAHPEATALLKKRQPKYSYDERVSAIKSFDPKLKVVSGDTKPGEWKVFDSHNPEMIFLGHDQHGIAKELERLHRPFEFIAAHHPEKYASSILNK